VDTGYTGMLKIHSHTDIPKKKTGKGTEKYLQAGYW
jgi:hypothetical protein